MAVGVACCILRAWRCYCWAAYAPGKPQSVISLVKDGCPCLRVAQCFAQRVMEPLPTTDIVHSSAHVVFNVATDVCAECTDAPDPFVAMVAEVLEGVCFCSLAAGSDSWDCGGREEL